MRPLECEELLGHTGLLEQSVPSILGQFNVEPTTNLPFIIDSYDIFKQSEAAYSAINSLATYVEDDYFTALLLRSAQVLHVHAKKIARATGNVEKMQVFYKTMPVNPRTKRSVLAAVCQFRLEMLREVLEDTITRASLPLDVEVCVREYRNELVDIYAIVMAMAAVLVADEPKRVLAKASEQNFL
ncbi:MAG: hypothetical protein ACRCYY_03585 [Trueperaceae bacterium]